MSVVQHVICCYSPLLPSQLDGKIHKKNGQEVKHSNLKPSEHETIDVMKSRVGAISQDS